MPINLGSLDRWSIKKSGKFIINNKGIARGSALFIQAAAVALASSTALANPTGGLVTDGSANISYGTNVTTIDQSSNNAAINWNSFDVSNGQQVNFNTPGSNALTVNRIMSSGARSLIDGAVSSNGRLVFINPNGFFFGNNANVNAAGIVATTANIADINSADHNYNFATPGSGNASIKISDNAHLNATDSGVIALVAPHVENKGTISAGNNGKVILVSAKTFSVDLDGDALINIEADGSAIDVPFSLDNTSKVHERPHHAHDAVKNNGNITGGTVVLAADTVNGLYDHAVNNNGIVNAQHLVISKHGIELKTDDSRNKKVNTFAAEEQSSPNPDEGSSPNPDNSPNPDENTGSSPNPDEDNSNSPNPDNGNSPNPDAGNSPNPDEGNSPNPDNGNSPNPDEGYSPNPDEGSSPNPGDSEPTTNPGGNENGDNPSGEGPNGNNPTPPPSSGVPSPTSTGPGFLNNGELGEININSLNRPTLSLAGKSIIYDKFFENFDVSNLNTNLSIFGGTAKLPGNLPATTGKLSNIEPAAGGDNNKHKTNDDTACANAFLDDKNCIAQ